MLSSATPCRCEILERAYVQHVLECIRRARGDSAPGREAVIASRTHQDSILPNLQNLCESTQRIDERHKREHPEIDWPSIAGMRNVLVHEYFAVDFETVSQIIERDLDPLEEAVAAIPADKTLLSARGPLRKRVPQRFGLAACDNSARQTNMHMT